MICSYEINGRKYGAIRNFRKYQRPKSPNKVHPISDDIGNYTGLTQSISEMEGDEGGGTSEIAPQRKEEGGRRKGGKKESKDSADAGSSKFAFESGIIKLTAKHFDLWRNSYSHLDLAAELVAMTPWAELQGKNWFHAIPNALAKRNREVKAKALQEQQTPFKWNSGMEGIL